MADQIVSIIIPVYNAEKYLSKCIKSVLKQTYKMFELILVDDGASDSSGEICDKFAKEDSRIKVVHTENGGVSRARNIGIKQISGEYVLFVDSDDYLEERMLEELVKAMKDGEMDLSICGFINENLNSTKEILPDEKAGSYSVEEIAANILEAPHSYIYGVLWNKLFKAGVIKEQKLKFVDHIAFGEDFIFNLSYISKIEKIEIVSLGLYHYIRYNNNSLMYKMAKQQIDSTYYCQSVDKRILIYKYYKRFYENLFLYETYKNQINDYLLQYFIAAKIDLLFMNMRKEEKKQCRKYLCSNQFLKECKAEMDRSYCRKRSILHFFSAFKGVCRSILVKN